MTDREREADLVRRSLRATTGSVGLDAFAQASLAVGLYGDAAMTKVLREEMAPDQAELDLHLTGEGVTGHSTNALWFAQFVARMSRTIKFTARGVANSRQWGENTLIEALAPGSVRVVLRAPDRPGKPGDAPLDGIPSDTPDSIAIRRVAGVITFASADDDADADAMVAAARALPPEAQVALKSAMSTVVTADWAIDGFVRQRWQTEAAVRLTTRGAERLVSALELNPAPPQRERVLVTVDGLKHSLSVAYLKRDGRGHAFAASVADDELLRAVAHAAEDPDRQMVADFVVYVDEVSDGRPARASRTLIGLRELDSGYESDSSFQPEFDRPDEEPPDDDRFWPNG